MADKILAFRLSRCCQAPIRKDNEKGEGIHYMYTMVCTKCRKPTEAMDEDIQGVIHTTHYVIQLTRKVWFHRGFWAGALFSAALTSFIWWVAS